MNRRQIGPDTVALFTMRRLLMFTVIGSMVLASLMSALGSRPLLSPGTLALLFADVALFVACAVLVWFGAHPIIGIAPLVPLGVLSFMSGQEGMREWLPVGLLTTISMYLLITSFNKPIGLVIAVLWPALFVLVLVPNAGTNAFLGPAVAADGWLAAIQYLGAGVGTWWVWNYLAAAAIGADQNYEHALKLVRQSIESQAEHRAWRESARRVHETVLNTITYVLSTASIDRVRLQDLLSASDHQSRVDVDAIDFTPEIKEPGLLKSSKPIEQSRILLACVLAGNTVAGIVYLPAVLHEFTVASILSMLFIAAGFLLVGWAAFVHRAPLHQIAYAAVLIPAVVPFVLLLVQPKCADVPVIAGIVNLAGFATLTAAIWSRLWIGITGLIIWVIGCFVITAQTPAGCQQFPVVGFFNTIVAVPIALFVVYLGSKALSSAQRQRLYDEERSDVLVGLARGEEAFNAELSGVIADAEICLTDIAEGAEFDTNRQATLFRIDSRIRAAMVVDTRTAGAFAVLAKTLVDRASIYGVSVKVRDLASSDDREPVGPELTDLLLEVILQARDDQPVIGAMSAGNLDMLSLRVSASAAERCGLSEGTSRTIGRVNLDVEESADNARSPGATAVVIVLSRTTQ